MVTLYPHATYKPLGVQTQPLLKNPTAIILHTMGGYLNGTDTTFRSGGYTGDESHFGIGGPADGINLDGVVWQWQDLDYTADAQYSGNQYGISIETSDGTNHLQPWSERQLAAIESILIWLCQKYSLPAKLMTKETDKGIGYHQLFHSWNLNGHDCPGSVRVNQLVEIVIPQVAARITITPTPVGDDMPTVEEILQGFDAAGNNTLAGTPVPGTDFIDAVAKRAAQFIQQAEAQKTAGS